MLEKCIPKLVKLCLSTVTVILGAVVIIGMSIDVINGNPIRDWLLITHLFAVCLACILAYLEEVSIHNGRRM